MYKKFLNELFLIITISILLTSCSAQEKNTLEEDRSNDKLSIYLAKDVIGDYFKEAMDEFNKNNKNVQIVSQGFETDFEAFGTKMTAELLAGEGPDILAFDTNIFPSIHRTVASGVFFDLDSLINTDKEFKLSDYNDKVMEAGIFKGKRYLVPLNYVIEVLTTTREKLVRDKFAIENDGGMTWEKVSQFSSEYMNNEKDKFFFFYVNPIEFFISSGVKFVDVDAKKANFKSSEFIKLLNTYKKIYDATIPDKQQKGKDFDYVDGMSLMSLDNRFMCKDISLEYKMQNEIVYPIEMSGVAGKVAAAPFTLVAINSKCKNKNAAFEYIKLLLSEKMQGSSNLHFVPVNKAAFMADKMESNTYNTLSKKLSENIGKCEVRENKVYSIIGQELGDFLNDKKTAEQTATVIQDKVNIFLNE